MNLKQKLNQIIPPRLRIIATSLRGNLSYNQDGLSTTHNCDFIDEPHFKFAYEKGKDTGCWEHDQVHWRVYILCWAANQVKNLEGDFVECGVYKGGFSRAVIEYINFKELPKNFYLIDTFEGLVPELLTETEKHLGALYKYDGVYNSVVNTFKEFSNVKVIKGIVPKILSTITTKKICYLSIDLNCVVPEIAAVNFFWDQLVEGGIIILDDYGWTNHTEQKKAFDEFAKEKGIQILSLPTGQGLIIKPLK